MVDTILGALKWGVVGFVVTLFLMVLFEASRIHDDIPVPEFKRRHTRRTTIVLSIFAGILSGLVWPLVQRLDSVPRRDICFLSQARYHITKIPFVLGAVG